MSTAENIERNRDSKNLRSWNSFKDHQKIGQGTYGEVFKAQDVKTGEIVVLKKVRFTHGLIREMEIMAKMNHVNVLKLKETFVIRGTEKRFVLVFEYMDHDFQRLRQIRNNKFDPSEIKCYMQQFLLGLHYLHSKGVLHRDIKGENLLINNKGILKIADFGLSKSLCPCQQNKPLTNEVITLYYRPPELLLGQNVYGPEVDIWSVGCMFAEMFLSDPKERLFFGTTVMDQLDKIFRFTGKPNESSWPGVTTLPAWKNINSSTPYSATGLTLKNLNSSMDESAKRLILKMLQLCPSRRISAKEALDSEYFWKTPLPCHPSSIKQYGPTTTAQYHEEKERERAARQRSQAEEHLKRQQTAHQNPGNLQVTQPQNVTEAQNNAFHPEKAGEASLAGGPPGRGRGRGPPGRGRGVSDLPPPRPGQSRGRGGGGRGPSWR